MSPGDNWNAIVPFQRHGVSLRPEVGFGMLYRQRVWLRGCQAETRAHPVVPLRTARIVLGARILPLRSAGLVDVREQQDSPAWTGDFQSQGANESPHPRPHDLVVIVG